jgi:hypothetical protein
MILPVVLYVCETRSLTLREEHRLRVFENMVHNEELHNLYFSPNIIRMIKSRRMRWAGHVTRMGEKRYVCMVLVGKSKRPLERLDVDGMIILK